MISDIEKQIIQKEVVLFLSNFCGIRHDLINPDSNIATDLNIEGDDAVDLLNEFSRRFSVDITSININEYFVPESYFNPLTVIWEKIMNKKQEIKPLQVKDFIEAAINKKFIPNH